MTEIKLSEDLEFWRIERPDEWIMDEFIRKAKKLEELEKENEKLKILIEEMQSELFTMEMRLK